MPMCKFILKTKIIKKLLLFPLDVLTFSGNTHLKRIFIPWFLDTFPKEVTIVAHHTLSTNVTGYYNEL